MISVFLILLFIFLVWNYYCMKRAATKVSPHRQPEIDDLESFVERRSGFNRGWD